ncbi:MAG: N-acetylglucosamine-6-phosphate deacetylase [Puniceicoccaceae bacterium]
MRLFDFQVNGFAGVDFQSDNLTMEELGKAADALHAHQTVAIFLTLITDEVENLCRKLERIETFREQDPLLAQTIAGYHLEGPWISKEPGYHGAHPVELARQPSLDDYQRLKDAAGGNLKLLTLAPELPGSPDLIENACSDGVRIALGHCNPSMEAIDTAIACGATLATHLGNAVPSIMDRHDNVIQRLLSRDALIACLIPDGIHLPPFVLKNFYNAKKGNVFFTTDCMSAAGGPPGRYRIGPHEMDVGSDGVVHLPGDTRFAGSSLTMDQAVDNAVKWLDLPRGKVVEICSSTAAEHFNLSLS